MKPTYVILAVAIFATVGQSLALSCKDQNPLISYLKGVTIYSSPKWPPASSCGIEWKTYSTCCDQTSLAAYVSEDKKRIKDSVERMNIKFSNYIEWFASLRTVFEAIGALESFDWKASGLVPLTLYPRLEEMITEVNRVWLKRPAFTGYTSDSIIQDAQDANLKCWKSMMKLRRSSLCSICSGNSSRFFFSNKANLDQSSCNILFDNCWESFKNLETFINRATLSGSLKDWETRFGNEMISITNPQFLDLNRIRRLSKSMEENILGNIGVLFEEYNPYDKDVDPRIIGFIKKDLCRKFIKLVSTSIIELLERTMTLDKSVASLGSITSALVTKQKEDLGESAYKNLIAARLTKNSELDQRRTESKLEQVLKQLETSEQAIQDELTKLAESKKGSKSSKAKTENKKKQAKLRESSGRNGGKSRAFCFEDLEEELESIEIFSEQVNIFDQHWGFSLCEL